MTTLPTADTAAALAQRVRLQFASRPTFEQVAQRMLEQALKDKYPWLTLDLAKTQLATPDVIGRGWHFQPFMPQVLDYLASDTPMDFSPRGNLDYYLSDSIPRRLWSGNEKPDMKVIKKLLLELAWSLPIGLEDALTRYWSTDLDTSGQTGTNVTRWGWLSDVLRNTLNNRASAIRHVRPWTRSSAGRTVTCVSVATIRRLCTLTAWKPESLKAPPAPCWSAPRSF
jgi:hypothetical protein